MERVLSSNKKSKGKILFLLDGDDYFEKNKICKIVDFFNKNSKVDFIQDLPSIEFSNHVKKLTRIIFKFLALLYLRAV